MPSHTGWTVYNKVTFDIINCSAAPMAEEITEADLKPFPHIYNSSRSVWDVLIGENTTLPLLEASSLGDDKELRRLLFQPQWTTIALEEQHYIYSSNGIRKGTSSTPSVSAMPLLNLEVCIILAAENGHAAAVEALLNFSEEVGVEASKVINRWAVQRAINGGHAAAFEALVSADPKVLKFPLGHGRLPLDDAIKRRKIDIAATMLRLGADPKLYEYAGFSYRWSLLCLAVEGRGIAMTELLLKYGIPVAGSGALHLAAELGQVDTMRLLMRYGADVNERLLEDSLPKHADRALLSTWAPMHFAASKGQTEAMKLLEDHGAVSDVRDRNRMTPAELLEGHKEVEESEA